MGYEKNLISEFYKELYDEEEERYKRKIYQKYSVDRLVNELSDKASDMEFEDKATFSEFFQDGHDYLSSSKRRRRRSTNQMIRTRKFKSRNRRGIDDIIEWVFDMAIGNCIYLAKNWKDLWWYEK